MDARTLPHDQASAVAYQAAVSAVARHHRHSIKRVKTDDYLGHHRPGASPRAQAYYLAVTAFNCSLSSIARAAGVSKVAVHKACRKVEWWRDDAAFDRRLQSIELELTQ
jgi:chromosomal replication initiation ATPase DnaA